MAGRPKGSLNKDKPFAEALRMELAAAGKDQRALRAIARNLIRLAQEPSKDALPAISAIADRLDGKPAQTIAATIDDKRDASDWSRAELVALIHDATTGSKGAAEADGRDRKPDSVH